MKNNRQTTLRRNILKGLWTLSLVSFVWGVTYAQDPCPNKPDAPEFDTVQEFCSEAAWALIGEDADYLSDLPIYVKDLDFQITWYRDSDLTQTVSDPEDELLVDGEVYYVTQTDADGCESEPLKIEVSETECGCIKDAQMEDQNGNPTARGYEFFQFDGITNHKTCGQSMFGAPSIPMGALDGWGPDDDGALVSKGMDPPHIAQGGNVTTTLPDLVRTNPNNDYSHFGLRLNRGAEYGGPGGNTNITSMSKKIIADEVFAFNFALIIQNPPSHTHEQMPFAQINVYDSNDELVQTRCMVSDAEDCVFFHHGSNDVLYTDWTCMKLNTEDFVGEPLRIEFITAYCTPQQHYAYMYLDDFYAGKDGPGVCDTPAFGSVSIDDVSPVGEDCYISEPPVEDNTCGVTTSAGIPGFPLEVCGSYNSPISQGDPAVIDELTLNVIQNGSVVGTVNAPKSGSGQNTFCFTVEDSDINVKPYGTFSFELEADFALDCGSPYEYLVNERSIYNLCPTAGCPDVLEVCDIEGDGFSEFDLSEHGNIFEGTEWTEDDVKLTYYEDEMDAHDKVNEISDFEEFKNTEAKNQTVYIRLEWDVEDAPEDCYYLMPLNLRVIPIPNIEEWEDHITFCEDEEVDYPIQGTPDNLEDLEGSITYKWYKDGKQLPHSGSIYNAKEVGEYTVVVADDECEIEKTVTIERIVLNVDMGETEVEVCDEESYTIRPTITSEGETSVDLEDVNYTWNTGDTTKELEVFESGTYTLEVEYDGCMYMESVDVNLSIRPEIEQIDDFKLCSGDEETVHFVLNHPELDNLRLELYRDGGLIAENVTEITISDVGHYKLVAGEDDGIHYCYEEMSFTVEHYDNKNCVIPEGLSPNNDGYNDDLDLEFLNDESGIEVIKIYNRYGVEVYSQDNYVNQWHGQTDNGKQLPAGTYYYVIKLKDGSEAITGYIYLNY